MPSGFRCKAISFSGLTTGILEIMRHVTLVVKGDKYVPDGRRFFCSQDVFLRIYFAIFMTLMPGKALPLATPARLGLVTCTQYSQEKRSQIPHLAPKSGHRHIMGHIFSERTPIISWRGLSMKYGTEEPVLLDDPYRSTSS
jgi:hypothetical protein